MLDILCRFFLKKKKTSTDCYEFDNEPPSILKSLIHYFIVFGYIGAR